VTSVAQIEPDEQRALLKKIKGDVMNVFLTRELNAETPAELLDACQTPIERLFVRNRGGMPALSNAEIENWTLTIDGGGVREERSWTIKELKEMGSMDVVAVLECAGNGRAFFPGNRLTAYLDARAQALEVIVSRTRFKGFSPILRWIRPLWRKWPWSVGTVMWTDGAVGCVKWTGVPLRRLLPADNLKLASENEGDHAVYVGHHSLDTKLGGTGPAISRGLPIAKALAEETLVAWKMNDEDIPLIHGGPLRLVAPGYPGSAWQKWIHRIEICTKEHDGALMDEYRIDGKVIEEMPVNSVITFPPNGFEARAGRPLLVKGYAWSGQSRIEKVRVSVDGGASWHKANLAPQPDSRFAWRHFDIDFADLSPGPVEIVVCAKDENDEQPRTSRSGRGNPIGYCNNVVRRVSGRAS
jgi:sulfite oxidase